ncbi:MAG: transposase [Nitrospirae bacterium]|nr:transposase [Nitrospirota bacterium]
MSEFGPRLASIIAYLVSVHHTSRRGAELFCHTLLGVEICLGSIQGLLEETSLALESMDKELQRELPDEPVLNVDETGWRDRWLWVFVTSSFIYFRVALSRGSQVLVDVLGAVYTGYVWIGGEHITRV